MPYKDKSKAAEYQREYRKKQRQEKPPYKWWSFIIYPESCPDWREIFDQAAVPLFVSPEHNLDRWTTLDEKKDKRHVAGELKKNHRHALQPWEYAVPRETVIEFWRGEGINLTFVKPIRSPRGAGRYLTHMDSPDKVRYSDDDVVCFGGADWQSLIESEDDNHAAFRQMREFIIDNGFQDFWKFQLWCDENEPGWSRLLDNHCYGIERFIKSYRASLREGRVLDNDSGDSV